MPIERARNRRAVAALSSDGNAPALCCENLGADYLTHMHDYTVEMYVKLLDLPTGTGWYYLFGALSKDSSSDPQDNNNRWMVTFRHNNSAGNYYWNHYSAGYAPMMIGVFLLGSIQLFFIGFLGEYVLNINTRVIHRPVVVEEERINFD